MESLINSEVTVFHGSAIYFVNRYYIYVMTVQLMCLDILSAYIIFAPIKFASWCTPISILVIIRCIDCDTLRNQKKVLCQCKTAYEAQNQTNGQRTHGSAEVSKCLQSHFFITLRRKKIKQSQHKKR